MEGVYTGCPGRILHYDAATQTADIQPTVRQSYIDETDTRRVESLPVLSAVPIISLGGGGFRTSYPVADGDTCWLMCAHCSIDRWLATGADVDPVLDHRHCLSDVVALVGLRHRKNALASTRDTMSMGSDSGATIEISNDAVLLGGPDASQAVVVASALAFFMTKLGVAITALGVDPSVSALTQLQTALTAGGGWTAGTSVTKAK